MRKNIFINFHDLVGFEICTDSTKVAEFYNDEYQYHIVDDIVDSIPIVSLDLSLKSIPPERRFQLIHSRHKFLANWYFDIEYSDQKINIEAYANYFGMFMIHHMMAHPGIRYLAAYQDVLMLHAGAVTNQGNSILITGKGGSGKTTTTSSLIDGVDQVSPHSDDYVFINQLSESLAYITRSHLYYDVFKWVPHLETKVTRQELLMIRFFSAIRKLSFDTLSWPTRVPQDRLWPNKKIEPTGKIKAILQLTRDQSPKPVLIKNSNVVQYANELLDMNFFEARHFIDLIQMKDSKGKFDQWLNDWRSKEYQLIMDCLATVPHYYLALPENTTDLPGIRNSVTDILADFLK